MIYQVINLNDVIKYDKIKYNTNNHWINGIKPDDYDQKTFDTYTSKWIDLFGINYIKIKLDKPSDILWMKKAQQIGQITKQFSKLFEDELEQSVNELENLYPEINGSTGYFVRTEDVSLKYGCHGVGPYCNFKSILESLVTSVIGHSPITENTESITLYLLPWIDIKHEFRVFVYNNKI